MTRADASEIINEHLHKIVKEIENKKTQLLAQAFVDGADGVDIRMEEPFSWHVDGFDYTVGFDYEIWEGQPPRSWNSATWSTTVRLSNT